MMSMSTVRKTGARLVAKAVNKRDPSRGGNLTQIGKRGFVFPCLEQRQIMRQVLRLRRRQGFVHGADVALIAPAGRGVREPWKFRRASGWPSK